MWLPTKRWKRIFQEAMMYLQDQYIYRFDCIVCLLFNRYTGRDGPSGYGYELTFRLKKEPGESLPPTWPAELLQALARYVFQTGTIYFLSVWLADTCQLCLNPVESSSAENKFLLFFVQFYVAIAEKSKLLLKLLIGAGPLRSISTLARCLNLKKIE